ncbi:MAG TPA: XkdF-like putative serine protease domain-containing protein [Solirubrobacterales bacterium]|nr:XkdF-like putative serine protease domain-containing protein [Solirubrobacterales bacterium]
MPVHLLRDADIKAISIVDKGANRKRFFLTKAEGDEAETLTNTHRLVKAEDWSTVYCVVAEPGWAENPGQGASAPGIDDVWAGEDEIRKAAHRFMANGGLVTKLHESLDPFGQLVENAVALADFTVNGETITKGSWYIAITPTEDGKAAIEKGEFTGVSIEGTAVRELVEKGKGSTRAGRTVGSVAEQSLLKRVVDVLVKRGDLPAEVVEKSDRTFGEIVAQREFDEALPLAFDAFRDAVWGAFFPIDKDSADPKTLISESCDEFKAWALEMLDTVPVEKTEREEALAKAFGAAPDGSTPPTPTFGEDTMTDAETKERFEKLEKTQADLAEGITKLTDGVADIAKAVKPEPEAPTVEDVKKELGDVATLVKALGEKVEKLGEGDSSQTDGSKDTDPVTPEEITKSFEAAGLDPDLAGIV